MLNYYCRLCLVNCKPEESSLFSKQITDLIEFCVPEVDIALVNNPIICAACHNLLKQTEGFKRTCLEVQNKIKSLISTNRTDRAVDLSLIKLVNVSTTNPVPSNVSFDDSYKKFLSNSCDSRSNSCTDAEVSKIMKSASLIATEDKSAEGDDFLDLLESSSNIRVKNDIPKSNGRSSYSNFYDDSGDFQSSSSPISEVSETEISAKRKKISHPKTPSRTLIQSKIKNLTVNSPLDVEFVKYDCNTCDLKLPDLSSLIVHLYTVHQKPGELLLCMLCRYKTLKFSNLKTHYANSHRDCIDLDGSCIFCGSDQNNFQELFQHMRDEHKKFCYINRYNCNSCDYQSRKYRYFKQHFFKSHDFICNICLKSFDTIECLNRHMGNHSGLNHKKNRAPVKVEEID